MEEANANCPLIGLLNDNPCNPSKYDENQLPSRKQYIVATGSKSKCEITTVQDHILSQLTEKTDYSNVPNNEQSKAFLQKKLSINNEACCKIEKKHTNTEKKYRIAQSTQISFDFIFAWPGY